MSKPKNIFGCCFNLWTGENEALEVWKIIDYKYTIKLIDNQNYDTYNTKSGWVEKWG